MKRLQKTRTSICGLAMIGMVGLGLAACNREPTVPVGESQAATPLQTPNQPTTVTGCLRAGEASGTFVLTAERDTTGGQTATYTLKGGDDLKLADHVGQQVELTGVVSEQQAVASRSGTQTDPGATGTSGTPAVSTSTVLALRELVVREIRPLADRCPN